MILLQVGAAFLCLASLGLAGFTILAFLMAMKEHWAGPALLPIRVFLFVLGLGFVCATVAAVRIATQIPDDDVPRKYSRNILIVVSLMFGYLAYYVEGAVESFRLVALAYGATSLFLIGCSWFVRR